MASAREVEDELYDTHATYMRSWREDFEHENGNYECICCLCSKHFYGHKRRVVCKTCSTNSGEES